MKSKFTEIRQGDICSVNFNPTHGDEVKKIRHAIVISGNFAVGLDLKIVAPITSWKKDFDKIWWLHMLVPTKQNGLKANSAVNCYQMRCISIERIVKKIGSETAELEEIIATAQNCIEMI